MNIGAKVRLILFVAFLLPPLASAQQPSIGSRQTPAAHIGACEAFNQSYAKFQTAKTHRDAVSLLRMLWDGYQQQLKLKQKNLLNHLCLTAWDIRIFSMPTNLIDQAKIPVQPEVIREDITVNIDLLKKVIPTVDERGDTESAALLRRELDAMQASLTSGADDSVLPSFIDVNLIDLQPHRSASDARDDGAWPVVTVKNRALSLDLVNVSFTFTIRDSTRDAIWSGKVTIPRLAPLDRIKVVPHGELIATGSDVAKRLHAAVTSITLSWDDVNFEVEPSTANVETILKNSQK